MQALKINFIATGNSFSWLGLVLLLVALLLAGYQGRSYLSSAKELGVWEKSWRDLKNSERKKIRPDASASGAGNREQLQAELKAANRTISRLSLPWDELFREIESTMNDRVTLLSIEPDTERKELRITAEAKDFDGVLEYARQISAIPVLRDSYVMNHQIQQQDAQKPVRFVVVAKWLLTPDGLRK
ncbi:PilN domain-containing protein [Herbaspirillum sp. RV1423]|uniref:PilN domain-containing protein n=1 Tax=Herbaspirillum sp. RV1423 TaxID=1443993 RepID=UPI0004ADCBDF|nr:PilN domain-containing protein [Herbaspirillum sp. RV1423]